MTAQEKFWIWFTKNNKKFSSILHEDDEEREKLLDEILKHLHAYCKNIWIQMGGGSGAYTELIFTAEGNQKFFDKVRDLVAAAPVIKNWKIIALMPPIEIDSITYDDLTINVEDLGYAPLLNSNNVSAICAFIYVRKYETKKKHASFDIAIHKILDLILGEECYADLEYFELKKWDKAVEPNILELRDYIITKKTAYSGLGP
jgi:hypothetical protein